MRISLFIFNDYVVCSLTFHEQNSFELEEESFDIYLYLFIFEKHCQNIEFLLFLSRNQ